MKSRVIIWTLVGIVVVAGAIFILTRPRVPGSGRMTAERLARAAEQTQTQVDRLSGRIVAARSSGQPVANPAKADEADRLLTEAREQLAGLKQVADIKQGEEQLRGVKQKVRDARRALELALGAAGRPQGF